jgi:hypothetical protein
MCYVCTAWSFGRAHCFELIKPQNKLCHCMCLSFLFSGFAPAPVTKNCRAVACRFSERGEGSWRSIQQSWGTLPTWAQDCPLCGQDFQVIHVQEILVAIGKWLTMTASFSLWHALFILTLKGYPFSSTCLKGSRHNRTNAYWEYCEWIITTDVGNVEYKIK